MFHKRFVARTEHNGIEVKRFWTRKAANRWNSKPMMLFGQPFSTRTFHIKIYEENK